MMHNITLSRDIRKHVVGRYHSMPAYLRIHSNISRQLYQYQLLPNSVDLLFLCIFSAYIFLVASFTFDNLIFQCITSQSYYKFIAEIEHSGIRYCGGSWRAIWRLIECFVSLIISFLSLSSSLSSLVSSLFLLIIPLFCRIKLHSCFSYCLLSYWLTFLHISFHKVFIQASGLACEVYVEVSPLRSLPTTVCEI